MLCRVETVENWVHKVIGKVICGVLYLREVGTFGERRDVKVKCHGITCVYNYLSATLMITLYLSNSNIKYNAA